MNRVSIVSVIVFFTGLAGWCQEPAAPIPADPEKQAAAIKPAPKELSWRRIPWVLNLAEGQQLAKQENRPIFLWVTGAEPLERC